MITRHLLLRSSLVVALAGVLAVPAMAADDSLSLVPANAATVGMVRLADMRTSPLSSMLFQHTDKMTVDGDAAKFLAEAGLSPAKDVDVLVVATAPREAIGSEADVLVIAEGRFNPERLTAALLARGAVRKGSLILFPESKTPTADHQNGAVAFPSASLVLAGNEQAVSAALTARANGGTGFRSRGALAMDLGRIDRDATAWALVDVTRASRLTKAGSIHTGSGQSGDALRTALRTLSTVAVWARDTGDALELGGCGLSSDKETLELLEDTIRGALSAMRLAVKDKSPEMVSVLRRFEVDRTDDSVRIEGSIPASTLRDLLARKRAALAP